METKETILPFSEFNNFLNHTFTNSQTIAYCKYNTLHSILLIVFNNGSHYEYSGVDKSIYDEFIAASSPGSYFSTVIRKLFSSKRIK